MIEFGKKYRPAVFLLAFPQADFLLLKKKIQKTNKKNSGHGAEEVVLLFLFFFEKNGKKRKKMNDGVSLTDAVRARGGRDTQ